MSVAADIPREPKDLLREGCLLILKLLIVSTVL